MKEVSEFNTDKLKYFSGIDILADQARRERDLIEQATGRRRTKLKDTPTNTRLEVYKERATMVAAFPFILFERARRGYPKKKS